MRLNDFLFWLTDVKKKEEAERLHQSKEQNRKAGTQYNRRKFTNVFAIFYCMSSNDSDIKLLQTLCKYNMKLVFQYSCY